MEGGARIGETQCLPPPLRFKRVNLAKRRIRRRVLGARKFHFALAGGPIDRAWLCTPGTLIFKLGEWHGYYDSSNEWVAL